MREFRAGRFTIRVRDYSQHDGMVMELIVVDPITNTSHHLRFDHHHIADLKHVVDRAQSHAYGVLPDNRKHEAM